mmetsp:Transcript_30973/g.43381  ORF Transcript_30973/g.43381 Transcript_30973/m.43381 type:complete len:536 (-) Transcript_30973:86-1693(-)
MSRIKGCRPEVVDGGGRVSVLSWNILAPQYCSKKQFPRSPAKCLDWKVRMGRILDTIARYDADIVCLQEMELASWDSVLKDFATKHGYSLVHQKDKGSKAGIKYIGNTTMFKAAQFTIEYEIHRSRVMVTALRQQNEENDDKKDHVKNDKRIEDEDIKHHSSENDEGVVWVIANAHLDATKPNHRLNQMKSLFKRIKPENKKSNHRLILCGDLNAGPDSEVVSLLQNGRVKDNNGSVVESGFEDNLKSAYRVRWNREPAFTIAVGGWSGVLDWIWFDSRCADCCHVVPIFTSAHTRNQVCKRGLPSDLIPSDHCPIAATFRAVSVRARKSLPMRATPKKMNRKQKKRLFRMKRKKAAAAKKHHMTTLRKSFHKPEPICKANNGIKKFGSPFKIPTSLPNLRRAKSAPLATSRGCKSTVVPSPHLYLRKDCAHHGVTSLHEVFLPFGRPPEDERTAFDFSKNSINSCHRGARKSRQNQKLLMKCLDKTQCHLTFASLASVHVQQCNLICSLQSTHAFSHSFLSSLSLAGCEHGRSR